MYIVNCIGASVFYLWNPSNEEHSPYSSQMLKSIHHAVVKCYYTENHMYIVISTQLGAVAAELCRDGQATTGAVQTPGTTIGTAMQGHRVAPA